METFCGAWSLSSPIISITPALRRAPPVTTALGRSEPCHKEAKALYQNEMTYDAPIENEMTVQVRP